jgi:hypothetical protein
MVISSIPEAVDHQHYANTFKLACYSAVKVTSQAFEK